MNLNMRQYVDSWHKEEKNDNGRKITTSRNVMEEQMPPSKKDNLGELFEVKEDKIIIVCRT